MVASLQTAGVHRPLHPCPSQCLAKAEPQALHARRLDQCPFLVRLPPDLQQDYSALALSGKRHHALSLVQQYAMSSGKAARNIPLVSTVRGTTFCYQCDSEEHRRALAQDTCSLLVCQPRVATFADAVCCAWGMEC